MIRGLNHSGQSLVFLSRLLLLLLLLLQLLVLVEGVWEWSFQQKLVLGNNTREFERIISSSSGNGTEVERYNVTGPLTYGSTPAYLQGRGFVTLITGYDEPDGGVFVHTTDEGSLTARGQLIWSQQSRLIPADWRQGDHFGRWMVAEGETLLISSPFAASNRGYVYVFNGTQRHWSQVQRLQSFDGSADNFFGEKMSLDGSRLVIAARGAQQTGGAAYIYERITTATASSGSSLFWSFQARLLPDLKDPEADPENPVELPKTNQWFGSGVSLNGGRVAVSARNDEFSGAQTGSVYVFEGSGGSWSQQQKLTAIDFQNYKQGELLETLDLSFGQRILGPSVGVNRNDDIAVGITFADNTTNRDSVYIFKPAFDETTTATRWSLQQRLFAGNDSYNESVFTTNLVMDLRNNLIATLPGETITASYVFKTFGDGWSLQQRLTSYNSSDSNSNSYSTNSNTNTNSSSSESQEQQQQLLIPKRSIVEFGNPTLWGGHLIYQAANEVHIRSRYSNDSCLRIWMSDHFLDGWDTAVLTVRAPDLTNDTYHPHCFEVDPFYVRYCPYEPEQEGVYIIKVFAAIEARFFWELSWQVLEERSGITYRGDFATKMMFNFNATTSSFNLVEIQNEIDLKAPCYRCTRIATRSWQQLQDAGAAAAFWPLVVRGAPYYISDYPARNLKMAGKLCANDGDPGIVGDLGNLRDLGTEDRGEFRDPGIGGYASFGSSGEYGGSVLSPEGLVTTYECYQTLPDGLYILRLGGGLFGRITGFPLKNASWEGCGESGTLHDQLVFRIGGGVCEPVQKFRYRSRCDRPAAVNAAQFSTTAPPTAGGSAAPTQSTFGELRVNAIASSSSGSSGGSSSSGSGGSSGSSSSGGGGTAIGKRRGKGAIGREVVTGERRGREKQQQQRQQQQSPDEYRASSSGRQSAAARFREMTVAAAAEFESAVDGTDSTAATVIAVAAVAADDDDASVVTLAPLHSPVDSSSIAQQQQQQQQQQEEDDDDEGDAASFVHHRVFMP